MKTTIDISDNLLNRAKDLAIRRKTTLKALTEEGLRLVLSRQAPGASPGTTPVVVQGQGLSPDLVGKPWAEIRDRIYPGSSS